MNESDRRILAPYLEFVRTASGMRDKEFEHLIPGLSTGHFKKGQVLLEVGSVCMQALFVAQGLLRVSTLDKQGNEHIVQFAPEGWFASDRSSLLFKEPSHLRIDAIEDTDVVMIGQEFMDAMSTISEGFRRHDTRLLHAHIHHMQDRIALLLGARAEERYQTFIAMYPDLTLRVPQRMIASYLGITPESLSRVRRELAERNFRPR